MAKIKPTLTEALLKQSKMLEDYDKAMKLYGQYQKVQDSTNINKIMKIKEELLSHTKSAVETLERLHRVYLATNKDIEEEMAKRKDQANTLYDKNERESYLRTIETYLTNIKQIHDELEPPQPEPEKEAVKKSGKWK